MSWLSDENIFPLSEVVQIDADLFKTALPEWETYVQKDPLSAGYHTRQESGLCCEITQEAALRARKHIWVDGSLRDGNWYKHVFDSLQKTHPAYQIAIFHIVADRPTVFERARSFFRDQRRAHAALTTDAQ